MVKHELNGNGGFGKAKVAARTFKATARTVCSTPPFAFLLYHDLLLYSRLSE